MADLTKAAPQEITATLEEVVRRRADLHQAILALERAAAEPAGGREEQWRAAVIDGARGRSEREIVDHIEITERDHGLYDEIIDVAPRLSQEHRAAARRASGDAGGNGHAESAPRERPGARATRRSPRRGRRSTTFWRSSSAIAGAAPTCSGRRTASTPAGASDGLTQAGARGRPSPCPTATRYGALRCASSSTPCRRSLLSRVERRCGRRISPSGRPTATSSLRSPPSRTSRGRSASSCSRTSAASTASTRSSRCASASAATPPSPSTTSAAPPAWRSATTSSRTWITSR